jgi:FKBP-type peptidyl-prolyl cis-trans isomerase
MMIKNPRKWLLALALTLGACSTEVEIPTIETTTFNPGLGVDLAGSVHTSSGLYYRDITVGGGALLQAGHTIAVRYTGYLANGTIFDNNGPPAAPFSFVLGAHTVIAGFDEGVAGMHVGGVRQLIIPPALGYGGSSAGGGAIPPNSILVFSVTVVSTN